MSNPKRDILLAPSMKCKVTEGEYKQGDYWVLDLPTKVGDDFIPVDLLHQAAQIWWDQLPDDVKDTDGNGNPIPNVRDVYRLEYMGTRWGDHAHVWGRFTQYRGEPLLITVFLTDNHPKFPKKSRQLGLLKLRKE